MGSEHYCLRWNNHQSNLLGVFSQLLESESLVDVTLACTEGPSIRAHKVVLSACSSYFQGLFIDHPNRHPIVILKDVRFAELRTLVDFMYKGEVNVEYCQLSALLKTAESLKVKGLADMTNINAAALQQQQQPAATATASSTGPVSVVKEELVLSSSPPSANAHHPGNSSTNASTVATTVATTGASLNSVPAPPPPPQPALHTQPTSPAVSQANSTSNSRKPSPESSVRMDLTTTTATLNDSKNGHRERDRDRDCRERDRDKPLDRDKRSRSRSRERRHHHRKRHHHLHNDTRPPVTASPPDEVEDDASAPAVAAAAGESNECPSSPSTGSTTTSNTRRPAAPTSPCPGPLALDRPRSRRDSDSAEETRGSLSPLSAHSGPSDMSLSNNTGGGGPVAAVTGPSLPQSRLPSPHSTEPLAGPSGLPPVQQVPLSLKKEVDWDRTEERSASSEMSTDYRLPPDPVSLALGLEPANWAGSGLSPADLEGSSLLSSAGFAAGLAGLARQCGVCLASFPSSWLLERHAILQHAGQPGDDKPFTCEQCGQRYRYRSAYVKHREQNHRARLPADKLFTCEFCGMQFRYLKSFKKHRLNHALERLQRAPSSESQALTERSDQVSSTGEPSQLETGSAGDASPIRVDSEPERDQPEGRDTPSEGAREEAASSETASVHDNPGDSGEVLLQDAVGATNLSIRLRSTRHLLSSSTTPVATSDPEDEEPRAEPDASTTSTSLNLSIHHRGGGGATSGQSQPTPEMAVDRRERRFACPFCGKCVRSKENLKLHVRKHTGERPFVCLFCGRAFGGKSDLTRHLRIHTGERPYHCEMCGKCFARADYLSKHLTTHIHQR